MNADGSDPQLLANTEGRATVPRWAPDGSAIYFTNCKKVDFGSDRQILRANLRGRPSTSQAPTCRSAYTRH